MALKTTLEQLEEVQAAISAVMAGQAYSMDGTSMTKADLAALEAREEKLLSRYRTEQGQGGPCINIGMVRR
jgi:DNA-binding IclR family transcriptional regulator